MTLPTLNLASDAGATALALSVTCNDWRPSALQLYLRGRATRRLRSSRRVTEVRDVDDVNCRVEDPCEHECCERADALHVAEPLA